MTDKKQDAKGKTKPEDKKQDAKGRVAVEFKKPWRNYVAGDVAGFDAELAESLVNDEIADHTK